MSHEDGAGGPKPSMRKEIAVGLRYVTGQRWLRSIAATTGTSNLFGNIVSAILILYLVGERGLAARGDRVRVLGRRPSGSSWRADDEPADRRVGVGQDAGRASIGFSLSDLPVAFAPRMP